MAAEKYARRCMIKLTCVCTRIRHSIPSKPAYKNVAARIQPLVTAHDVWGRIHARNCWLKWIFSHLFNFHELVILFYKQILKSLIYKNIIHKNFYLRFLYFRFNLFSIVIHRFCCSENYYPIFGYLHWSLFLIVISF